METKTILIVLAALVVGHLSGYLVANQGNGGSHMMPGGQMMMQNIDQHFIVQMIPHHEGAIDMARLALERSKRPEMLQLANAIIAAQTREINDMTSWHKEWFGSVPAEDSMGEMGHMGGMMGDPLALSRVADADFDREFIDQMIPHHEMAVMMANMLSASTQRPEMKKLAQDIISSQTSEISQMKTWRASWYK